MIGSFYFKIAAVSAIFLSPSCRAIETETLPPEVLIKYYPLNICAIISAIQLNLHYLEMHPEHYKEIIRRLRILCESADYVAYELHKREFAKPPENLEN